MIRLCLAKYIGLLTKHALADHLSSRHTKREDVSGDRELHTHLLSGPGHYYCSHLVHGQAVDGVLVPTQRGG